MIESIGHLAEAAKQLVLHIVEEIVDHDGSDVRVDVSVSNFHLLIELRTARGDVGQVVGKSGSVATAIRTILAAFAGKNRIQTSFVYVTEQEIGRGHSVH